jgi:hypothetical protein
MNVTPSSSNAKETIGDKRQDTLKSLESPVFDPGVLATQEERDWKEKEGGVR